MPNKKTRNGFLFRLLLLVLALGAVIILMVVTMQGSQAPANKSPGGHTTFFQQFVIAGGPIVWFVLLPMSLAMVYLAAEYCLVIRRQRLVPPGMAENLIGLSRRPGLAHLAEHVANRQDIVSVAAGRAFGQAGSNTSHAEVIAAESIRQQVSALFRKIEWLNLLGNVSPMVGLFGTVFGMIKLFNAIVAGGGQPQIVQLADGISVALVTTFWGLFIAIPALGIYGIFHNKIETLATEAALQMEFLLTEIERTQTRPNRPGRQTSPGSLSIRELPVKNEKKIDQPAPWR